MQPVASSTNGNLSTKQSTESKPSAWRCSSRGPSPTPAASVGANPTYFTWWHGAVNLHTSISTWLQDTAKMLAEDSRSKTPWLAFARPVATKNVISVITPQRVNVHTAPLIFSMSFRLQEIVCVCRGILQRWIRASTAVTAAQGASIAPTMTATEEFQPTTVPCILVLSATTPKTIFWQAKYAPFALWATVFTAKTSQPVQSAHQPTTTAISKRA